MTSLKESLEKALAKQYAAIKLTLAPELESWAKGYIRELEEHMHSGIEPPPNSDGVAYRIGFYHATETVLSFLRGTTK